jgi:hypothetical protein
METFEQHFSTWTGTDAMRNAIIAELEAMPNANGDWSTPVYAKRFVGSHRWCNTGISVGLHKKDWGRVIATIKKVDPEFYARYTTEQAPVQPDYRALYEQAQRDIKMLELELSHAKEMVELYKSFRP